jgi:probable phosphoglycerate mutase
MRDVLVVTRTEAEHHNDGLVGGWFDSVLSEIGHRQASLVADRIRASIPAGTPCRVYSSDLRPAVETA